MEMTPEFMESFAAAMGGAIAEGMSKHDDEKREKDEERRRAELAVAERAELAELVSAIGTRGREARAKRVCRAVDEACAKARDEMLEELGRDAAMVKPINYVERYNALRAVGDSHVVAQKLELTLDQADALLEKLPGSDVSGALERAAASYAERVAKLADVVVAEPDLEASSELIDLEKSLADKMERASREVGGDLSDLVHRAFDEVAGPTSAAEAELAERRQQERTEDAERRERLLDALRTAIAAARKATIEDAQRVAGAKPDFELPEPFASACGRKDAETLAQVTELSHEVRRSFATFREVMSDNGVFAAFAGTGSYGSCNGRSWFWDDDFEYMGERPGATELEGIECGVEEDQGGDSLERCIERMREFNAREYWGMLDDDFEQHVDAFWYGFSHYMDELGTLCRVDMRPFKRYCNDVDGRLHTAFWELALRMDDVQAKEFVEKFK